MTCPQHAQCAYTGTEDARCSWCHAPWAKITAPAMIGTAYQFGYGETAWGHSLRHIGTEMRIALKPPKRRVA